MCSSGMSSTLFLRHTLTGVPKFALFTLSGLAIEPEEILLPLLPPMLKLVEIRSAGTAVDTTAVWFFYLGTGD